MSWHEYERIHSEILREKEREKKDLYIHELEQEVRQLEMAMQMQVKSERYEEITLVDRIVSLLRGRTLTRDSIRRIKDILCDCAIYEDVREEEWKRTVMEKMYKMYNLKWNKKEEKETQSDFIEAGEMEI